MMRSTIYAVLGFTIATIFAWGGLVAWGMTFLDPRDSLFDRNEDAADIFYACWISFATLTAVAGAVVGRRRARK